MAVIRLLEQATIDKIAAGEVVERPRSVVKELTENSIDAGATAVTVEIKDGGIGMVRVTDDGAGIPADQVRTAFLRHATSKIVKVDDLTTIQSFGFRGEALSSIAAVSRIELITKTEDSLTGTRYRIEGGIETGMEEIGAPNGSTFIMRDLFYNTPARRKFLRSAQTEAGYVGEFCERLALSHPDLALRFMVNGTTKLSTSGNGRQMDVIYQVFGKDISRNLIEVDETDQHTGVHLKGYLGKPQISRGNRTYEIFYVNGRLISSNILSRATEEGYETFLMQHRFPFVLLSLELDGKLVDVNVHPAKAQVRFSDGPGIFEFISRTVKKALTHRELIIRSDFGKEEAKERAKETLRAESGPEPFEEKRREHLLAQGASADDNVPEGDTRAASGNEPASGSDGPAVADGHHYDFSRLRTENPAVADSPYGLKYPNADSQRAASWHRIDSGHSGGFGKDFLDGVSDFLDRNNNFRPDPAAAASGSAHPEDDVQGKQMSLDDLARDPDQSSGGENAPDDNIVFLTKEHVKEHRLIGQVFDTYWIVQFRSSMYIIDQHAAHEKVMFERLMKRFRSKEVVSQRVSPPIIVPLSMAEEDQLQANMKLFTDIGFEISPFGDRDYSISAVPTDLYGLTEREFFLEMLDNLSADTKKSTLEDITARVATMACKAAVKGNTRLSFQEADALIDELLTLEDPYNCPHGRPTIISMTRQELEKKFKRIV